MAMNSFDSEIGAMKNSKKVCTNPHCQQRIRQLEEELLRVKSVGYDMLKQKGGWQAVGKTPSDRSLDFNNFFDHEVEDFSKSLVQSEGMEEDKARQLACEEFQEMNNIMESIVLNRLMQTLGKVFGISNFLDEHTEQLYDICRAYGLLLNASGLASQCIPEEISAVELTSSVLKTSKSVSMSASKLFTSKSAQLSWNLLTTIPPLLSLTPSSAYFREWHEKELPPTWNKDLVHYDLVYYRPILFMSCEGKVARKGWVGNKDSSPTTDQSQTKHCSKEPLKTDKITAISSFRHESVQLVDLPSVRPTLHSTKHTTPYPGIDDEKPLPKKLPNEPVTKFYPQSIDVDASGLSGVRKQPKQQNYWDNWTAMRFFT